MKEKKIKIYIVLDRKYLQMPKIPLETFKHDAKSLILDKLDHIYV